MLQPDVNNQNINSQPDEPTQKYPGQLAGTYPYHTMQPPPARGGGLRTGAILLLTLVIVLVFGVGLFAGWQFGQRGAVPTLNGNTGGGLQSGPSTQATVPPLTGNNVEAVREAVIAKVKPAVVQVNVDTGRGAAIGSGVIVDKRGYIVTNNHVVSGAQNIQVVLSDGTKLTAQLTGTDPADDLAVVKITPPANMAVAALGDSSQLRVGQDVLAIGNPLGITQTVTNGIISALGRPVDEPGGARIPDAIQTDAPINPGNSGGALVDMQGNLIGIPTLTAIDPEFNTPASGVGFAIPANRVKLIVPQIINTGKVAHTGRAAMGVSVTTVDSVLAAQDNLAVDHGVLIADVVNGGAAAKAGLQAGDVIVQIDNTAIDNVSSLTDVLATKNPGDTVSVKVYRGNQQLTVNVTLGELQAG
ncbi:MAG TPA: trypsin-like peptidase domain-containing protein [Ktedonobacteraceae bacterium]|nr:trypsin-like peptidase domain-containing protein [Ktedonobacteraceae bacterium]